MKQLNKKMAIADWKTCLVALVAGFVIATIAWMLTHLSFLLTWLAITVGSIPIWAQVIEWAKKRYPHMKMDEALFCYLFMEDSDYDDEENDYEDIDEDSNDISSYY